MAWKLKQACSSTVVLAEHRLQPVSLAFISKEKATQAKVQQQH
jgi:hypothetical protein